MNIIQLLAEHEDCHHLGLHRARDRRHRGEFFDGNISNFQANIVFLLIALRVVLSVKSRERTTPQRLVGWLKVSLPYIRGTEVERLPGTGRKPKRVVPKVQQKMVQK